MAARRLHRQSCRPPRSIRTTQPRSDGPYRGRGVASGFWRNNTGPSSAIALVHNDGTVKLIEGSPDIGGTRTSVSQQFAEVLGIPITDINPSVGDTDSSRLHLRHRRQRRDLQNRPGGLRGGPGHQAPDVRARRQDVELPGRRGGVSGRRPASTPTNAEQRLTFKQVAARQNATGGPIVASAGVNPGGAGPSLARISSMSRSIQTPAR